MKSTAYITMYHHNTNTVLCSSTSMVTGRAARPGRAFPRGPRPVGLFFSGLGHHFCPQRMEFLLLFVFQIDYKMQHYNINFILFIHKLHYYPIPMIAVLYIFLIYQSNFVFATALNCCCLKRFPQKPMQKFSFQHSN